jgi:c-di-AMP phosphodiesterase-like protein
MAETTFEKRLTSYVPLPMCVVSTKGKVIGSNDLIGEVFIYDEIKGYDFFALTGIKIDDLIDAAENNLYKTIERSGKKFRLFANRDQDTGQGNIFVFFYDITNYEDLKEMYNAEKICVCIVNIDNYDEMMASTPPDMRMTISSQVDKTIRKWAADTKASIINNKDYEYILYFQNSFLQGMIENKFSILDEVRQIETEADFPMSLSIGVGVGGKNIVNTEEFASAALDLALGRGGDQAVVKKLNKIDYYGGKLQTVEKGNKGKSRVVAHTLKQLIDQSGRIFIMGHGNPDMDAFGSALGMFRVCQMCGREASIVIDEINDSLQVIFKQAKDTGKYTFISSEKAMSLADESTLLIVLDTHRPSYLQCRELIDMVGKIAIIDHHRKAVDAIKNPALSYIESYASSTAELVSEILQYAGPKRVLNKLEAEALLAGMTIDTNRFAVKTGVRTFEAAAWLRRSGADTTEVKRFFQTDLEAFKVRAKCIASANIYESGIATSACEGYNEDAQIINSQVADELLNIKGVRASFVAGRNAAGKTGISARSLGDINVQLIMEKLGGGGHLTTAGAQVEESPEEVLEMVRSILINDILKNEKR